MKAHRYTITLYNGTEQIEDFDLLPVTIERATWRAERTLKIFAVQGRATSVVISLKGIAVSTIHNLSMEV